MLIMCFKEAKRTGEGGSGRRASFSSYSSCLSTDFHHPIQITSLSSESPEDVRPAIIEKVFRVVEAAETTQLPVMVRWVYGMFTLCMMVMMLEIIRGPILLVHLPHQTRVWSHSRKYKMMLFDRRRRALENKLTLKRKQTE
ncbi:hypothetical protein M0R45_033660 [Rubus argutus]|uniref:Transmembrane protein n=1 Tax=Rubus argutus TaxID=59490 RepID=A0AAW1WP21_RUBAR